MGLFDSMWGGMFGKNDIFSTGYDVTQGLNYQQGVDQYGVNQSQAASQNNMAQQQAFLNALSAGQGLNGLQSNVLGQQQGLANQYQAMANGQGPNPAQAALAEQTGRNMQQQAALMNSARGAQSNPGLVARQSSRVGGQMQQQATGQAATLQAQQQLAGLQGLGGAQNSMANLATAGVGQQQNALSQLNQQGLSYQQMLQNALQAQNQQNIQARMGQAEIAKQGMQNTAGAIGGGLNAVGGMLSGPSKGGGGGGGPTGAATGADAGGIGLMESKGGVIPNFYYDGGVTYGQPSEVEDVANPVQVEQQQQANQPRSLLGQQTQSQPQDNSGMQVLAGGNTGANAIFQGMSKLGGSFGSDQAQGGENQVSSDSSSIMKMLPMLFAASRGGPVPGKAKTKGDSLKNDTVPAMLSPGEIVIPRSHVDSPEKIASFLNNLLGTKFKNHG